MSCIDGDTSTAVRRKNNKGDTVSAIRRCSCKE
jgi:hypothetical protein